MTKRNIFSIIGLAALMSSAALANDTANLTPSATVSNTCTVTGNAIAFGTYNTLTAAAVQHDTTIAVTCTNGMTAPKVRLGQGANAAAGSTNTAPLRQLNDGTASASLTHNLTYNLYSENTYTTVWENTTGIDSPTPSGSAQNMNVYGQIAADQHTAFAGTFTDTVVVTVVF